MNRRAQIASVSLSEPPSAESVGGEIDLRLLAWRLWSKRWWIAASVLLFTGVFTTMAFVMRPVYRSTVVVVSAAEGRGTAGSLGGALGAVGGLAALAGINLTASSGQLEEALAVLRSRQLTEGFIKDENLMPVLFQDRWDAAAGHWKGSPDTWPTLAQAYRYFDKGVRTINYDKKTGLVMVDVEWHDAAKAAQWANGLIARLNSEMRSREIASSTASIAYLEKELSDTTTVDTRQTINRLLETQINKRMFANVTEEYSFRVVDKALPADPKDVVRPKKLLLILLGPALGLMFAAGLVLLFTGVPHRSAVPAT
jgi:uncharacterized protein involved in exopolysaccharide biosynthesis